MAGNFDLLWKKTPFGQVIKQDVGFADPDQLYYLKNDPDEQNNLAKDPKNRKIMDEMKKNLAAYVKSIGRPFGEFGEL